jgi:hypothetical protein
VQVLRSHLPLPLAARSGLVVYSANADSSIQALLFSSCQGAMYQKP